MIDIKIGSDGDIILDGGDLKLVDNIDSFAQGVSIRLGFMAGEWFKDDRAGIVENEEFQNIDIVNSRIRTEIMNEFGAVSIAKYESTFNAETRKLDVIFEVNTIWGTSTGEKGVLI